MRKMYCIVFVCVCGNIVFPSSGEAAYLIIREIPMKTTYLAAFLMAVFMTAALGSACNETTSMASLGCRTDLDCANPVAEYCHITGDSETGTCELRGDPCDACNPLEELCIDDQCVPKWGPCNPALESADCLPCQLCDSSLMLCTGEPCLTDGDADADDDTANTGDAEDTVAEEDAPAEIADEDEAPASCIADSDCPENHYCGENRICVPGCTVNTALCDNDPGTCNPLNGKCECCDPHCQDGTACNFSGSSWYCGEVCEPPCPDGYACNNGSCIEVRCSTCPNGYTCDASTCFKCVPDPDGDQDIERRSTGGGKACLPASEACVEGVSECCSGACILGHCM